MDKQGFVCRRSLSSCKEWQAIEGEFSGRELAEAVENFAKNCKAFSRRKLVRDVDGDQYYVVEVRFPRQSITKFGPTDIGVFAGSRYGDISPELKLNEPYSGNQVYVGNILPAVDQSTGEAKRTDTRIYEPTELEVIAWVEEACRKIAENLKKRKVMTWEIMENTEK